MLQRNTGAYPLVLPTLDPPQTVPPGGVIDHPTPLAGFEPVVDEAPAKAPRPAPKTAPDPAPAPASASPAAAAPDAEEA